MPVSKRVFTGANVDEDVAPANTYIAGVNLHLEPGSAYPATGNNAVPYALPQPGTTTTTQVAAEPSWFVQHVFAYVSNSGGPGITTSVGINYVLATGTYPDTASTYSTLQPYAGTGPYLLSAQPTLPYGQAFGPLLGPPITGYTATLAGASGNLLSTATLLVQRTVTRTTRGGRCRSLGGFVYGATGSAVELLWNVNGEHRLIRYDPAGRTRTTLLEWEGLNLTEFMPLSGGIIDNVFVFVDADGELRAIDLQTVGSVALSPASLAYDAFALHLVKHGPPDAPAVARISGPAESTADAQALEFATRFVYQDGSMSVLSPHSRTLPSLPELMPYRLSAVLITWATPPFTVQQVQVLVRIDGDTTWQVLARIDRQTTGAIDSTVQYTGATLGQSVTAEDANRDAESLWPCATATIASSRVIAGNFDEGYLTPAIKAQFTVGDYRAAVDASGAIDLHPARIYTRTVQIGGSPITYTYAELEPNFDTATGVYVRVALANGVYSPSEPQTTGVLLRYTYNQAFVALGLGESPAPGLPNNGVITRAPGLFSATDYRPSWHEEGRYSVAIQFRDGLGRVFGVSPPTDVYFPVQSVVTATELRWTLPAGIQAAIPAKARTYQFVVSRNRSAGYFIRLRVGAIWGGGDPSKVDGVPLPADLSPPGQGGIFIWLDISPLTYERSGYVFAAGSKDRVRFISQSSPRVDVPIVAQVGQYVVVRNPFSDGYFAPQLLPGGTVRTPLIQIYSPVAAFDPLYYERGPVYPVVRTSAGSSFSQTTGTLYGSEWVIGRGLYATVTDGGVVITPTNFSGVRYPTLSVSPTFAQADLWLDVDRGRPALEIPLALQRVRREALLRFSGVKVAGTKINGLSQWEALSQYEKLPQEQGGVVRLTVADQTQADGSILFVNQEKGATSLALNRGQIQTADGTQLITIANDVLGGNNALRGGWGCVDPRAVVPAFGKVFYPCREREEVLRYDVNGNVPLGEVYKYSRRLKALFRQYKGAGLTGCYDPRRKEYWLTFQPHDELPGASIVFHDRPGREAWADQMSWVPEAGLAIGNELTTWLEGGVWQHRPDAAVGTFGGVYTVPSVQFTVADPASVSKRWMSMEVVSESLWVATFVFTDTGQFSQTLAPWWKEREGVYILYEGFRRDQNTPGFTGQPFLALDQGNPLVSPRLTVTLQADEENPQPLSSANVSWLPRAGGSLGV